MLVLDGVIIYERRVVIPGPLSEEVLQGLNAGHQGVHDILARGHQMVFWPRMVKDVQVTSDRCGESNENVPS